MLSLSFYDCDIYTLFLIFTSIQQCNAQDNLHIHIALILYARYIAAHVPLTSAQYYSNCDALSLCFRSLVYFSPFSCWSELDEEKNSYHSRLPCLIVGTYYEYGFGVLNVHIVNWK